MKQEDKELLLKDLCARLPYGFVVHRYSDNRDITFKQNEIDLFAHFLEYSEGKNFKPYLRPMSSMTEEEKIELSCLFGGIPNEDYIYKPYTDISYSVFGEVIDWLNAHHFDYQGLISKGLALEAPEEMYK